MKTDADIIKELMSVMPVGNVRTHTPENLPERLNWFVSETVRQEQVIDRLEALLTKNGISFPDQF